MIELTRHTVAVPHLPESVRGMRVVQLTDLHRSSLTSDRLLRHAVSMANAEEPDLILLTGDFVTENPTDIAPCMQILSALRARLGVFAILGNHDYVAGGHTVECALEHIGVTVLLNRHVRLDNGLNLVGIDDDRKGKPAIAKAFSTVGADEPVIVLVHNPRVAEKLTDRAAFIIAGHTHGGQINIPFLVKRALRRIGAKHYRAGWYPMGKASLYVNRGLGQVGVGLRLFAHPEVALFTLTPEAPPE